MIALAQEIAEPGEFGLGVFVQRLFEGVRQVQSDQRIKYPSHTLIACFDGVYDVYSTGAILKLQHQPRRQ